MEVLDISWNLDIIVDWVECIDLGFIWCWSFLELGNEICPPYSDMLYLIYLNLN